MGEGWRANAMEAGGDDGGSCRRGRSRWHSRAGVVVCRGSDELLDDVAEVVIVDVLDRGLQLMWRSTVDIYSGGRRGRAGGVRVWIFGEGLRDLIRGHVERLEGGLDVRVSGSGGGGSGGGGGGGGEGGGGGSDPSSSSSTPTTSQIRLSPSPLDLLLLLCLSNPRAAEGEQKQNGGRGLEGDRRWSDGGQWGPSSWQGRIEWEMKQEEVFFLRFQDQEDSSRTPSLLILPSLLTLPSLRLRPQTSPPSWTPLPSPLSSSTSPPSRPPAAPLSLPSPSPPPPSTSTSPLPSRSPSMTSPPSVALIPSPPPPPPAPSSPSPSPPMTTPSPPTKTA